MSVELLQHVLGCGILDIHFEELPSNIQRFLEEECNLTVAEEVDI